jgi:S-DNA-T family DNA segregation ATPase FtsK/SpoIIIE
MLVLDVHDHASAELVGARAPWCVDPSRRPAGRGVLLTGRACVVVQVYAVGSS